MPHFVLYLHCLVEKLEPYFIVTNRRMSLSLQYSELQKVILEKPSICYSVHALMLLPYLLPPQTASTHAIKNAEASFNWIAANRKDRTAANLPQKTH